MSDTAHEPQAMTGALARSIGAIPELVEVQVYQAGAWHRRVRLGAMGWWVPDGCDRNGATITRFRPEAPGGGLMCRACWPVWPATR